MPDYIYQYLYYTVGKSIRYESMYEHVNLLTYIPYMSSLSYTLSDYDYNGI